MKVLNKIAILTFATTMMVAQAQAIELVKVEPVTKFSITKAAQESLADSMKMNTSNITLTKVVIDAQMAQISDIKPKQRQNIAKSILIAE
jgi:hypothetical protein